MEMSPPWARFPDYEHLCLGWRMGSGESYLGDWWAFVDTIPMGEREDYLRRHPPAPHTWYEVVWSVLGAEPPPEPSPIKHLVDRELIASDVAYRTWRRDASWPWDLSKSLRDATRYETRRFAFLSRALQNDHRRTTVAIPWRWRAVRHAIRTGECGPVDPRQGLKTLGIALCAGAVLGPWTLGLEVADVQDSFDNDMNYADAFQLWMMAVFDDMPHFEREVERLAPPTAWRRWMYDNIFVPTDG